MKRLRGRRGRPLRGAAVAMAAVAVVALLSVVPALLTTATASAQATVAATPSAATGSTGTSSQSKVPSSPSPSWLGDFSTGNWSQYDGSPAYNPDGVASDFSFVTGSLPTGVKRAFDATVASGSGSIVAGQDGERTLLTLWPTSNDGLTGKTRAYQGADSWYRDEIYFPSTFQASRDSAWNWVYELHNFPNGPCCANVALDVVTDRSDGGPAGGERLSVRVTGGGSPTSPIDAGQQTPSDNPAATVAWIKGSNLQLGHWYDVVWHVHWDWRSHAAGGAGLVEYWVDGTKIGTYSGPTLFYYASLGGPGQAYLQDGYYRPDDTTAGYAQPTVSVYHADTMIGPTAASIGENLP